MYINEAIRRDLLTRNPYIGIKIDGGKSSKRRFLTTEEISKIKKANLPTPSIEKVRDLFMFRIYTGLAYSDMKRFDFRNTIERNGKHVILDQRQKTKGDYYIVLLPTAMRILKKYSYKLPVMSLTQYNMRLKIIADAAGIDKSQTSHMSRHTYATMSLNAGVSFEIIAKMMGHTDVRTTQIYGKLVDKSIESAYEHLESVLDRKMSDD